MFDDSNRPKIGVALAITVVALVVWLVARSGSDSGDASDASAAAAVAPVVTAINGVVLEDPNAAEQVVNTGSEVATTADAPSRPRVESPEEVPVFMEGEAPSSTSLVPQIAVPERPAIEPVRLSASYRSTIAGFRTCIVQGLTTGLTVTVTNLANGRSITCVTALAPADAIDEVVMHTRTFQEIADLTEAPINVEITR